MNRMTELLERINYDLPGLKKAKMCYAQGDADGAMDAVIEHFCTRTTPKYLFTAKEMEQCTADVINTYVYRKGLIDAQFSYSTAVGMFNCLVSFALVMITNKISQKVNGSGLW